MTLRRALPALIATALTLGAAASARAQGDSLGIRASRRDTIRAGATVTAAFTITSHRGESVDVLPHVEVPQDWTVLMGGASMHLAPRSAEVLILSLVVPGRAAAGVYPIRVWVTTRADTKGIMDSIVVLVPARRSLEVGVIDRPGFIVSGRSYDAGFIVRNRGNAAAVVRLAAKSSLGAVSLPDSSLHLNAEEARLVRATVRTPGGLEAATDDVLEISATQAGDSLLAEASTRVTVVPEPSRKIEEYLKVPTQVRLRAATTDGVAPFEVSGRGAVRDGGPAQLDFLFRGRTGAFSAFGERDEYRAELVAPNWRARVGDQFFMLSPLTGGAQPGFGLGADGTRGAFSAGAYGQQFRRDPLKGTETGAFLGARAFSGGHVALNFVDRVGGLAVGQVGSAATSYARGNYDAGVEIARSTSPSGSGSAHSARLTGSSSALSYDFGHQYADTSFSGTQRGALHDYLTANSRYFDPVSVTLNVSRHRSDLSRSTGVPYIERLEVGTLAATLFDQYTLELGTITRGTTVSGLVRNGTQHGARARADQEMVFGLLSLEAEVGRTKEDSLSRVFTNFSLGARKSIRQGGVALWAERYSGGSITKGADGTTTVGGDASLHVSRTTDLTLMGYATRLSATSEEWHSQIDALVSQLLPNGTSLTLRARLLSGGSLSSVDRSTVYLEYGVPLRLPVSRLRTPGRVYGRVVDAVTGIGVPGALVRLGPQVAITDKQGQVAFGGVPGGQHRVSMSQETSFADAVFVGDPTLVVDSTQPRPTTFRLAIARSARLDVAVRRFAAERTGIAGAADSLVDAGPVPNALLVLAGERDTLYRTTSDNGQVVFTDVPPGKWTVTIRGDAPAFHRFDPDRLELTLTPGETKALTFRLVPRRREVQLIGEGQELRPSVADPKGQTQPAGTKTVKPREQKQDR